MPILELLPLPLTLPPKPGASPSHSPLKLTTAPSWRHIQPQDLRDPQRRFDLHRDACRLGVIGNNAVEQLKFFAAIARVRRLGTINPCGMLRRIVQTTAYHGYIADCDEDQGRAWLRELERQPVPKVLALVTPQAPVDSGPTDSQVYRILALDLMRAGEDPNAQEAYDVVRQNDKRNVLRGWTRERWEAAKAEALGRLRQPELCHQYQVGPANL